MAGGLSWATWLAIILAMETSPLAEVKNRLSEYVDRVARERARVMITRNGRPAAVLVSPEDLESLEETLAILGDANEVGAVREGLADLDAGRVVTLDELKADIGAGG
jgi:prevent-host-death family protein